MGNLRSETQRAVHYWNGQEWTDQPGDARRRLVAKLTVTSTAHVENAVEERNADGAWEPANTAGMSALEKGLSWKAWAGAVRGTALVLFVGVRAIDHVMAAALFDGVTLYGHDGEPLEAHSLGGVRFALSPEDARRFSERVRAAGGAITRSAPQRIDLHRHLATIASGLERLERVAQDAERVMSTASSAADMHSIGEANGSAWKAVEAVRRALTNIEANVDDAAAVGPSTQELVADQRQLTEARQVASRAETAFAAYRALEDEAARRMAAMGVSGAHHEALGMDSGDREALFGLWSRMLGAGVDARMDGDALVVNLGNGEAVITTGGVSLRRR